MALTPEQVARLDQRAREVGESIGWDLRFVVAPNPEIVGVTASAVDQTDDDINHIFVIGPAPLGQDGSAQVESDLARLASGERRIVLNEDGDPRLA